MDHYKQMTAEHDKMTIGHRDDFSSSEFSCCISARPATAAALLNSCAPSSPSKMLRVRAMIRKRRRLDRVTGRTQTFPRGCGSAFL